MNQAAVKTQTPVQETVAPTRPMYWSIRREIWENRSIYIAPLIVTAFVLFGSLVNVMTLPHRLRGVDLAQQRPMILQPYLMAPAPIMLTTFLVAMFYTLDALYGERRDRSILFWKSLPISDRTTVLAKVAIPMLVLPTIAFLLGFSAQLLVIAVIAVVVPASGFSAAPLWSTFSFYEDPLGQIYGLIVHALWFAPIYGWFLLVSAWAKRAPFLWAVLPLIGIGTLERVAIGTTHFSKFMTRRLNGAMATAWDIGPGHDFTITTITPLRFLTTPALWIGLLFAAGCVAAAIRMRRLREPI